MPPSQVRKEEAELRQIAKQARLVRKEAKARERKQKQREARKAAAGGEDATAASSTAPRKRQAALILPDELQELRQRLAGEDGAKGQATTTTTTSPAKKGAKSGGKKGTASSGDSKAVAVSTYPEPSYHLEIHYKKKAVMVDVVLHHIPHQKIDVSESTATTLVVDTTKHTKKMRLELPMPQGVSVKLSGATFDLESGILKCVLPIVGDEVPAEHQEQWDKMIQSIRDQKALRFRVTKDGDLTVRTRQALLAPDAKTQAAIHAATQKAKGGKRAREAEAEEDGDNSLGVKNDVTLPRQSSSSATAGRKASSSSEGGAPAKKAAKADLLKEEHARAMEVAKQAAAAASASIKARVRLAHEVQQHRSERVAVRSTRKESKEEKKQAAFQRVLEEQKQQLLARASLQADGVRAEKKRAAAKQSGAPSKSVSFAAQ